MTWIYWLIAIIIFSIAEAATVSLVSVWFIIGSFIAMIIALAGGSLIWQILTFLLISTGCLLVFLIKIKPTLNKRGGYKEKTNADRILEQEGIVLQKIDPLRNTGLIKVKGQIWSAASYHEQIIETETLVLVKEIKGVKAIVVPKV